MHSCDTTILIPQEDEASVELELYVTETDQDQQAGSMLDGENKPEQKGHRLYRPGGSKFLLIRQSN